MPFKERTAGDFEARTLIDRRLLKQLSRPVPGRLLAAVAWEWLCIALLVCTALQLSNAAADIVCIVLIATRQHALLVLMHEFAHGQFSRHRAGLNDLLGDLFTALPMLITVHGFRRDHMAHHRHVWTDRDPNFIAVSKNPRYRFPRPRQRIFWDIAMHGLGRYTWAELKASTIDSRMSVGLPRRVHAVRIGFYMAVAGTVAATKGWTVLLLYWLVPLVTVLMAILYVRDIGEHIGMASAGVADSRSIVPSRLERLMISPYHVGYHAEHHLFPAVPWLRLKRLHGLLMQDDGYRRKAHVTHGYLSGLLQELAEPGPAVQARDEVAS